MTSDAPSASPIRKPDGDERAAPSRLPSASASTPNKHDDGSPPFRPRPVVDPYYPQREPHRSLSSLGSRPFDSPGHRPVMNSYRQRAPSTSGYGHAAPKRKAPDSPERVPDHDNPARDDSSEPSRKKRNTGRHWEGRQMRPFPDRAVESPRNPFSSYSAASTGPAQPIRYHNEAYAGTARGRVPGQYLNAYHPQERQSLRPRSPPRLPPPRDYYSNPRLPHRSVSFPSLYHQAWSPSSYQHHQQQQPYPPPLPRNPYQPPPPNNNITINPSLSRQQHHQPAAPPLPQQHHHHHHHHQPRAPAPSPAKPTKPTTKPTAKPAKPGPNNPKHLPPLLCTPRRIVWVKKLPRTPDARQGWHSHPAVVFDAEDPLDADPGSRAWVATTTSWTDFRGLDGKFASASAGTRAEFEGSFCAVVHRDRLRAEEGGDGGGGGGGGAPPVVVIEGADVFEQKTYVDGRAVRRVRKGELCKYIKKGTWDGAFVTEASMVELKTHFRELARRGNGVWDPNDLKDLRAWARWDAEKERRKAGEEGEGKEEGEISDGE